MWKCDNGSQIHVSQLAPISRGLPIYDSRLLIKKVYDRPYSSCFVCTTCKVHLCFLLVQDPMQNLTGLTQYSFNKESPENCTRMGVKFPDFFFFKPSGLIILRKKVLSSKFRVQSYQICISWAYFNPRCLPAFMPRYLKNKKTRCRNIGSPWLRPDL